MGEDVRISGKASSNEIPLRPLSAYDEREAEFLIPQRVPRGQITIIGGDGGTGKSFLVVDTRCILVDAYIQLSKEIILNILNGQFI